mgnify:CR=1 FL=1
MPQSNCCLEAQQPALASHNCRPVPPHAADDRHGHGSIQASISLSSHRKPPLSSATDLRHLLSSSLAVGPSNAAGSRQAAAAAARLRCSDTRSARQPLASQPPHRRCVIARAAHHQSAPPVSPRPAAAAPPTAATRPATPAGARRCRPYTCRKTSGRNTCHIRHKVGVRFNVG